MPISNLELSGAARITRLVAYGTFGVAVTLTALILVYDIFNASPPRTRFWIGCGVIAYTVLVIYLSLHQRIKTANWLLILLFELLASVVLINWGLSSTVGILTASFAILLPGIFMTPRSILPVTVITLAVMLLAHMIHVLGIVTPIAYIPPNPSSALDVIAYATILSVFALVSWVSARQSTLSLERALDAEEEVRKQKNSLARELEKESNRLRQAQLQQIQQLYKFAVIGQSTAATLHELSNHLSVLNLDIDDMKQQHRHSKAIENAEDGIKYINRMIRKARAQLNNTNSNDLSFNVHTALNQCTKDLRQKLHSHHIELLISGVRNKKPVIINGDPINLIQALSILINNAIDACTATSQPQIKISVTDLKRIIKIRVSDNGSGIDESIRNKIFQPLESTKPSGLGVGLYIAKHLIESQFNGTLECIDSKHGATFQVSISKKWNQREIKVAR